MAKLLSEIQIGEPQVLPANPASLRSRAQRLHYELQELTQRIDDTFIEVGIRLKEIRDQGLYKPLDHPNFTSYVKDLEFSRSRAYALIGVVEDFYLSSRLDKAELLIVGWEKLAFLRPAKDAFTFKTWFEKAKQMGKRQLRQELSAAGFLFSGKEDSLDSEAELVPELLEKPLPEKEEVTIYYLAVKKLTAVKKLNPDEVEAARHSGKYPLIVGVVGSIFSNNGSSLGLPLMSVVRNDLPVLGPEDDAED